MKYSALKYGALSLTADGGTFSGTQTWCGPNETSGSSTCHAALVLTKRDRAAQQQ
ncbi:MAG TPA: hypothetical protein VFB45_12970 [Pseudolabrys sp.]|nr:hypothetical protein [Pseudolabrys sp.]